MERLIDELMEILTDDCVERMAIRLEERGLCLDYLDQPYTDGTYKTEQEKKRNIIEDFLGEMV